MHAPIPTLDTFSEATEVHSASVLLSNFNETMENLQRLETETMNHERPTDAERVVFEAYADAKWRGKHGVFYMIPGNLVGASISFMGVPSVPVDVGQWFHIPDSPKASVASFELDNENNTIISRPGSAMAIDRENLDPDVTVVNNSFGKRSHGDKERSEDERPVKRRFTGSPSSPTKRYTAQLHRAARASEKSRQIVRALSKKVTDLEAERDNQLARVHDLERRAEEASNRVEEIRLQLVERENVIQRAIGLMSTASPASAVGSSQSAEEPGVSWSSWKGKQRASW